MSQHQPPSFSAFRSKIASLPLGPAIDRTLLDTDSFTLGVADPLKVVYAPFDFVNDRAQVMIVGVTPGWTQMHTSFVTARAAIERGEDDQAILRRVKRVAAFAGSMRTNLVAMLDGIGMPEALGVPSSSQLFTDDDESLLHSTSAVRYPVFKAGKNYTGSSAAIEKSELLSPYLSVLADEASAVSNAVIVPLGKAVESALRYLIEGGAVGEERCLFGFPHPSGVNARRTTQYSTNKADLHAKIAEWF